ncbi:hypothetical protein O3M35_012539 [Rhynocoris fuscipes]
MIRIEILTVTILLLVGFNYAAKLPSNWRTCKRSDKNMVDCVRSAVVDAVKSMKDGFPSLGVLPLDPMHFDSLSIGQGSGPVSINLDFKNMDINGISTLTKLENAKVNWEEYTLQADASFASPLTLRGDYSISGQVLVLPIVGKGKFNLTFDDFVAKLYLKGHEVTKAKNKYMEVDKFTVQIETSKLHIYLGNLFNGDKALGDNMNLFINENWQEILKELRPAISKAFGEAFKDISNRVFRKIPITQIAPK